MQCSNCGEYFRPKRKRILFTIFDRYYVEIQYPENDGDSLARLNPLFSKLVQDIRNGHDIEEYRDFEFYIHAHDMQFSCPQCQTANRTDFALSLPDKFFLYIEAHIDFEVDNILLHFLGMPASKLGIDTLDLAQLQSFLNELPSEYDDLRELITKLFKTKQLLPILVGRGGGFEVLDWVAEQVSGAVLGAVVSFVITSGLNRVLKKVRNLGVRNKIRRKIRENSTYWDDISFEALSQHISVPKDFKGSKEELIEKIIENKVETYKQALIEKLRHR